MKTAPPATCGACLHAHTADTAQSNRQMYAAGWLNCRHEPVWRYFSPRASCTFTPSRFTAKFAAEGAPSC